MSDLTDAELIQITSLRPFPMSRWQYAYDNRHTLVLRKEHLDRVFELDCVEATTHIQMIEKRKQVEVGMTADEFVYSNEPIFVQTHPNFVIHSIDVHSSELLEAVEVAANGRGSSPEILAKKQEAYGMLRQAFKEASHMYFGRRNELETMLLNSKQFSVQERAAYRYGRPDKEVKNVIEKLRNRVMMLIKCVFGEHITLEKLKNDMDFQMVMKKDHEMFGTQESLAKIQAEDERWIQQGNKRKSAVVNNDGVAVAKKPRNKATKRNPSLEIKEYVDMKRSTKFMNIFDLGTKPCKSQTLPQQRDIYNKLNGIYLSQAEFNDFLRSSRKGVKFYKDESESNVYMRDYIWELQYSPYLSLNGSNTL